MLIISIQDKSNALAYLRTDGRPWLEVLLEISRGLVIIVRKQIPFIRYSVICGIYTDDDL
ncbi:MAG: hypothetical protein ACTSPY_04570 [Candidatus Helarchaeota archaeon]